MARSSDGYYDSSGYGSYPATDRNLAEHRYSSDYGHGHAPDSLYRFDHEHLNTPQLPTSFSPTSRDWSAPTDGSPLRVPTAPTGNMVDHVPTTVSRIEHTQSAQISIETGYIYCFYEGCGYQTKRQHDLDKHMRFHFPSAKKLDCPRRVCGRKGEKGFDRKDVLIEHMMKIHAKDIPKRSRAKKGTELALESNKPGDRYVRCVYGGCEDLTIRYCDLSEHMELHLLLVNPNVRSDCPEEGCSQTGVAGFDWLDDLKEHRRKYHARDIPKQCREARLEVYDCPENGCRRTGIRAFARKDNLKNHLRLMHGKIVPRDSIRGREG